MVAKKQTVHYDDRSDDWISRKFSIATPVSDKCVPLSEKCMADRMNKTITERNEGIMVEYYTIKWIMQEPLLRQKIWSRC